MLAPSIMKEDTNLIPKQHLLEFHRIDWIKQLGFGMALGGEQGGDIARDSTKSKGPRKGSGMKVLS